MELSDNARAALLRFFRHLPQQSDLTLIVLKGHLLIEGQMRDIVRKRAPPREADKIDRWTSFSALTRVTRAYAADAMPNDSWKAIDALNALRNSLAHKLDPTEVDVLVSQFAGALRIEEFMGSISETFGVPDTPEQRLKLAIALLCGQLMALV